MYTRTVNGKELDFGVSGKLYKDALVMYDRQTDSLWTQVDGTVLRGPMQGAQLKALPLTQTTWEQWKTLHPDTLVLKREGRISRSMYERYFNSPSQYGISGEQKPDPRLPGKALVVSLRHGTDALAVPVERLRANPLHETTIDGRPVLVLWNPGAETAAVFDRRVGDQTLDFEIAEREQALALRDSQTGSVWNGLTGQATAGELKGRGLKPVQHMVNFWWAWAAYNPHTRIEPE